MRNWKNRGFLAHAPIYMGKIWLSHSWRTLGSLQCPLPITNSWIWKIHWGIPFSWSGNIRIFRDLSGNEIQNYIVSNDFGVSWRAHSHAGGLLITGFKPVEYPDNWDFFLIGIECLQTCRCWVGEAERDRIGARLGNHFLKPSNCRSHLRATCYAIKNWVALSHEFFSCTASQIVALWKSVLSCLALPRGWISQNTSWETIQSITDILTISL